MTIIFGRLSAGPASSIDRIVSNLPFGKQVDIDEPEEFFSDFIKEMARITKENALIVFLTTHSKIIIKCAEDAGLKLENRIAIINSGLESEIIVLKK